MGRENLHLVVDTIAVGYHAEVGHVLYAVAPAVVAFIIFDEHFCVGLIYRRGIAQVDERCANTDNQGEYKPFPIKDKCCVNGLKVE